MGRVVLQQASVVCRFLLPFGVRSKGRRTTSSSNYVAGMDWSSKLNDSLCRRLVSKSLHRTGFSPSIFTSPRWRCRGSSVCWFLQDSKGKVHLFPKRTSRLIGFLESDQRFMAPE